MMAVSRLILLTALCLAVSLLSPTSANFNLYLTQSEVRRILGLHAELYYVREGVVNEYAMNWRVPVPAQVHRLYFTWQALSKKPVLYNMAIWTNETEGGGPPPEGGVSSPEGSVSTPPMGAVTVNVSLTGQVPTTPLTFRLDLPCLGTTNAEVDVVLNINVTSPRPRQPPTILYFKRRKICLKGQSWEVSSPQLGPPEDEVLEGATSKAVLYYIVPALAGLTLVLTSVVSLAYIRRRRLKRDTDHRILSVNDLGVKSRPLINPTPTPNNINYTLPSSLTINSYTSLRKLGTPISPGCALSHVSTSASLTQCSRESGSRDVAHSCSSLSRSEVIVDPSAAEVHERFRQMEVERQRVRLTAVAHEGSFGRVFRGWIQRDRPEQDQQVLIKTVTEDAPHDEVVALYREGTHLFNLYHRNVLTMVGISFADNSSPFLIYPFHGYQNLKQYLQEHRGGHLRAAELVELAVQAAHGLAFLHTANVLHGDIAARNCVVSEKLQLRITDGALSRDLFSSDYEVVGVEAAQPIKWMAYETITERLISTASDVWAYGVLVWELTTLAQQPYVEVASCEMAEYLRDGYRLAQPLNCPDDLYKVMAFCWAIHPHDRPHAKLILDYLDAFHHQLNDYI